jgi:hypothetical protein
VKRVRLHRPKSKSMTSAPAPRLALFGQPGLLEGEDAAAYDQLRSRIYAAVKPLDIVEEMFIEDVVSLEWEVLRWRRLKSSLIRARGLAALEEFFCKELGDDTDQLVEILQQSLPEDQADLAQKWLRDEPGAANKLNEALARHINKIQHDVRAHNAKELVQAYVRREPDAVKQVDELLVDGVSMDALMADALAEVLDTIERFDRLTTNAENRRNASLFEIDRRRAILGKTPRRSVQEIEDGEFEEVIETTPAKGKNAA